MTIKEIAKLANVSTSTISRVVNDSGYVKKEVREKIEALIEETGYRPNAYAKALLLNKSHTIGVILPKINSSSSGDTVAGIDEYIHDKGYTLILGNSNHNINREIELYKVFQEKMVDGIILVATELTSSHMKLIEKSKIPTVILGQESLDSTPCVIFDEIYAASQLTKHLIDLGRKNIAFIGVGEYDVAVGIKRKEGFLKVIKEKNLNIPNEFMKIGDFTVESGYNACKEIYESGQLKPDAIFAVTDKMAIGAITYLFEKGIKVPEDVSVVGMGGGYFSKYFRPKITTSKFNYLDMGYEGAKLLFSIISENVLRTKKIVLNNEFIMGESTKG